MVKLYFQDIISKICVVVTADGLIHCIDKYSMKLLWSGSINGPLISAHKVEMCHFILLNSNLL
jgi:hypothetical protein